MTGCGQQNTSDLTPNMQEFINTFDGTMVGSADAFNKFSIDGEVRNNPVIKYEIQQAKVAEFKPDSNCYKVEFFGKTDETGSTDYLYGNICWNETNDTITKVNITAE